MAGTMANPAWPSEFSPTPSRTDCRDLAPYSFCTRPGETMNDGARMESQASICRTPAPVMLNNCADWIGPNDAGWALTWSTKRPQPPRACNANGTARSRPDMVTDNSTVLTNTDAMRPPAEQ